MEIQNVDIDAISPAPYNPRKITDEQFEELKKSIIEVGFIIPIIINKQNNIIIAGHQRTKAAKEIGLKSVPAFYVDNIKQGDEIKFNQLHNGVDIFSGQEPGIKSGYSTYENGFNIIDPFLFDVNNTDPSIVKEMCKLILKYGNVFCACMCNGKIVVHSEYIKVCQLLNIKCNVTVVDGKKEDLIKKYFQKDYGEYSYENIDRNTYVQGLAQMHRHIEKTGKLKKANKSTLYEKYVLPYLKSASKNDTVLDFGCGKAEYINFVKKTRNAIGVEFYNNNGTYIDVEKGNRMIDDLLSYLKSRKTFDIVVCDSVLNSIDSMDAQRSLMSVLNLFCEKKLFISGRTYKRKLKSKDLSSTICYLNFYDDNGFTANYRKGNWYFQKYHSYEEVIELVESNGFKIEKYEYQKHNDTFQVMAEKIEELPKKKYIDAINFEFNLPLPHGSYNRHKDILKALEM